MPLKIDLHVHTSYSYDSLIPPENLVFHAKKRGLDGIAITDHDTMDAASRVPPVQDFMVIPGIEISSLYGHIIGLNVEERVPPKLGVQETVDRIHDAGGLAIACHPLSLFRERITRFITADFDAIEVVNASSFPFVYSVQYGQSIASRLELPSVGGSDAHYGPEIGRGYTVVQSKLRIDSVIQAIKKGACSPHGEAIPLKTRLKREILSLNKKMG